MKDQLITADNAIYHTLTQQRENAQQELMSGHMVTALGIGISLKPVFDAVNSISFFDLVNTAITSENLGRLAISLVGMGVGYVGFRMVHNAEAKKEYYNHFLENQ